jgi:hypothetical protein
MANVNLTRLFMANLNMYKVQGNTQAEILLWEKFNNEWCKYSISERTELLAQTIMGPIIKDYGKTINYKEDFDLLMNDE